MLIYILYLLISLILLIILACGFHCEQPLLMLLLKYAHNKLARPVTGPIKVDLARECKVHLSFNDFFHIFSSSVLVFSFLPNTPFTSLHCEDVCITALCENARFACCGAAVPNGTMSKHGPFSAPPHTVNSAAFEKVIFFGGFQCPMELFQITGLP